MAQSCQHSPLNPNSQALIEMAVRKVEVKASQWAKYLVHVQGLQPSVPCVTGLAHGIALAKKLCSC